MMEIKNIHIVFDKEVIKGDDFSAYPGIITGSGKNSLLGMVSLLI